MREIKFRAWDKRQKCFQTWEFLSQLDNLGEILKYKHTNYIPCQFTGLLYNKREDGFDSNGDYKTNIEVYRHDILEYTGACSLITGASYYATMPPQKGEIFLVIQTKAGFMLENLSRSNMKTIEECINKENGPENQYYRIDNYSFWNGMPSLKLIGNIYENPELLKQ